MEKQTKQIWSNEIIFIGDLDCNHEWICGKVTQEAISNDTIHPIICKQCFREEIRTSHIEQIEVETPYELIQKNLTTLRESYVPIKNRITEKLGTVNSESSNDFGTN